MKGGPLEEVRPFPEAGKQARKLASQKLKASQRSAGGRGAAPAVVLGDHVATFCRFRLCSVTEERVRPLGSRRAKHWTARIEVEKCWLRDRWMAPPRRTGS